MKKLKKHLGEIPAPTSLEVPMLDQRPEDPGTFPGPFTMLLGRAEAQNTFHAANPTITYEGITFTFVKGHPNYFIKNDAGDRFFVQMTLPISSHPEISDGINFFYKVDVASPTEKLTVSGYPFWTQEVERRSPDYFWFMVNEPPVSSGRTGRTSVPVSGAGDAFKALMKKLKSEWDSERRAIKKAQKEWDAANADVLAKAAEMAAAEADVELTVDCVAFAKVLGNAQMMIDTMQAALVNKTFSAKLCSDLYYACNNVAAMQRDFKNKHCSKKGK